MRTGKKFTLKDMAEAGYIMGLPTIGEVASHVRSHYDAYFLIDTMETEMGSFDDLVKGHEDESIFKYLSDEDKRAMDDELEAAMKASPGDSEPMDFEEKI
jgi:hypothetical protein